MRSREAEGVARAVGAFQADSHPISASSLLGSAGSCVEDGQKQLGQFEPLSLVGADVRRLHLRFLQQV